MTTEEVALNDLALVGTPTLRDLDRAIDGKRAIVNAAHDLAQLEETRARVLAQRDADAAELASLRTECAHDAAAADADSEREQYALECVPDRERTAAQYRTASLAWRRAFSRFHDLHHVTHDRQFYRPYYLPPVFHGMREKLAPVNDHEWKQKIVRLRQLIEAT